MKKKVPFWITGAVLLGAAVWWVILMGVPFCGQTKERAYTASCMNSFAHATEAYWRDYGRLPHGDAATILSVLTGENRDPQNPKGTVFLDISAIRKKFVDKEGRLLDGWMRPFIVVTDLNAGQLTIISLGKNGKNDSGKGDDLVVVVSPSLSNQ
jgi:hypothetical protein